MKKNSKPLNNIPPMSMDECKALRLDGLDFVYICGDAYIDHPSFGSAIITRVLQHNGYSVGIIAQPDWHSVDDFRRLGKPRLAFLVSSGNLDSMVNHYTASKRKRTDDAYTEGGKAGKRPDRAVIVYANRCKEAYSGVPVIIGGLEASLRRFAHYDYWDNKVRHSILYDACADILLYGMGESSIVELADALDSGKPVSEITEIRGSCYRAAKLPEESEITLLPSYLEVAKDKSAYAKAFMMQYREQDAVLGKRLAQQHEKGYLIANPPALPLSTKQLDAVYDLPFTRRPHPNYKGHIPALDEVEFSITSARGCFGGCNFCALTFHQGRVIQPRSHESIIKEATQMTKSKRFSGYIHDVGGPTANFRKVACRKQKTAGVCKDKQCIGFKPCKNLEVSHTDYVELLEKLRQIPKVKKVFVRSGVRYDYVMYDHSDYFLKDLIAHHVSGQLKIAPEHISDTVLYYMNKPSHELYERFMQRYEQINKNLGLKQYAVPYLMSSHPGCRLEDAVQLAVYLKEHGMRPQQVQDFYPTPGTLSTCMYYTGMDPRTGEKIYVPFSEKDKQMQRALMQYFLPQNFDLVRKALELCNRGDLIGYDKNSLVPPKREREQRQKPIDKKRRTR